MRKIALLSSSQAWSPSAVITKLLSPLMGLLMLVGCSRGPYPESTPFCESHYAQVIGIVLGDAALNEFGATYFEGRNIIVVWEGALPSGGSCQIENLSFKVIEASSEIPRYSDRLVIVNKFYLDDAAAFVEISLHPTGKHSEFFLRNKRGWKVVQRKLWET